MEHSGSQSDQRVAKHAAGQAAATLWELQTWFEGLEGLEGQGAKASKLGGAWSQRKAENQTRRQSMQQKGTKHVQS